MFDFNFMSVGINEVWLEVFFSRSIYRIDDGTTQRDDCENKLVYLYLICPHFV